jgi:hypothetical protein
MGGGGRSWSTRDWCIIVIIVAFGGDPSAILECNWGSSVQTEMGKAQLMKQITDDMECLPLSF